ncbi:DUF763 domain-containing protein [Desulfolucanica intricata]|uniref:DUF763 domain-containing protein n=1 Tax=Desulfolucanica intricata TaxID=1285191 RepID=UPI003F76170F
MANLPLHSGKCPPWLFSHMKQLGAAIIRAIVEEYGSREVLVRLSDPVWFQALGCILGFDWHSSGLTTTVCGALKEGLEPYQQELGLFFTGGKGKTSRKTPREIEMVGEKYALSNELQSLAYASKMAAKVDSAALQDGFQLYHHFFVFNTRGNWTVVQQGMNDATRYARRYHWLGEGVSDFVCEPHAGIACEQLVTTLNMVAKESAEARAASIELTREKPEIVLNVLRKMEQKPKTVKGPVQLAFNFDQGETIPVTNAFEQEQCLQLTLPAAHDIPNSGRINSILYKIYDRRPENFEKLLAMPGVGPASIRALAMVAEIVHGVKLSFRDPVRYSFAHGGKDGIPFPVDRKIYRQTIDVLEGALKRAKLGNSDKLKAFKRLSVISGIKGMME